MAPEMPSDCPAGQRTQPIGALRQGGLRTRDPWDAEIARRYWRGPLSKMGPKYLRWALIEAAVHAAQHPIYSEHSQRTKTRLGRQRGAKVARVEVARKLTEAIWHMLQTGSYFSLRQGPATYLVAPDDPG